MQTQYLLSSSYFCPQITDSLFIQHLIASFGELSFNANQNHSRRNAGIVSDGNHGQTRVQLQSSPLKGDSNQGETSASNVAILLLIPEKTYMEELYTRHASKHQTKEKVRLGSTSLPFRSKNELTLKWSRYTQDFFPQVMFLLRQLALR